MGVPGASRCPVGHTPVERAPGALGPWALRGWAGDWVPPSRGPRPSGRWAWGLPRGGLRQGSQARLAPQWRRPGRPCFSTAAPSRRQGGALGGHTRRRSVLAWCRLGKVCVWDARRGASGAVFWRFRGVVGPNLDPSAPLGSTHSVSVRSLPSTATFGPSTSPPLDRPLSGWFFKNSLRTGCCFLIFFYRAPNLGVFCCCFFCVFFVYSTSSGDMVCYSFGFDPGGSGCFER